MATHLSIIIVSWKVKDKLLANLEALKSSGGSFKAEVFIVDNNSGDGTIAAVQNFITENNGDNRFSYKLIISNSNLGFAKANNLALAEAKGEFVLLLNPDMKVFSNTLENMLSWCHNNPQATVSGCRLEDELGGLLPHVRRFPKLIDQLAIVLKLPHLFPNIAKNYLRPDFDYSKPALVDSVRGAFFMINIDAFKKLSGGVKPFLDERYFIWFEEVDFCRQVKKMGGEVWYTPAACCLDYVGASFSKVPRGQTQRYFRDSMLAYFKKWEPRWQSCLLSLAWKIGFLLAILADKLDIKRRFKA